jgi:hypothetical protein
MRLELLSSCLKLGLIGLMSLLIGVLPVPGQAAVSTGKIYVEVFWDENDNGIHDRDEDVIGGVPIVITREDVQGSAPSLEGKSGYETTKFFLVAPGRINVALGDKGPLSYTWTTVSSVTMDIAANEEMRFEFGVRAVGPNQDNSTGNDLNLWLQGALIALWIIPILLSAATLVIGIVILRRLPKAREANAPLTAKSDGASTALIQ